MPVWRIAALLMLIPVALPAQDQPPDTSAFYKDMYRYSKEKKALYFLYRAFFNVPPDPVQAKTDKRDEQKGIPKWLAGKTIRSVTILTFEPFGASLGDTGSVPHSFLQKAGNALHVKSRQSMIRDYLLFKAGDKLDLLKVAESERLLRQSDFIRDVIIMAYPAANHPEEVDVKVFARDFWTIEASVTVTTSKTRTRITDYNFMGWGHRFRNKIEYDQNESDRSPLLYEGTYLLPNIEHTYISAGLLCQLAPRDDRYGAFAERLFYSAETNWAGGIRFDGRKLKDSIRLDDVAYGSFRYTSQTTGFWAGRSFKLRQGQSAEERSTRFVLSTGYTRTRYPALLTDDSRVASYFRPVDQYLASIGVTNRKYFTDRYIYDFGEREDVPTGRMMQVTAGYETRGETGRIYSGFKLGASGYVGSSGYISATTGFGTYIDDHEMTEGILNGELFVFSRLFRAGKWHIRWFGYSGLTLGLDRLDNEFLTLQRNEGLPGYKYSGPIGTTRLTLSARVLFFNPLEWLGFRFTPVVFAGMGMMGSDRKPLFRSTVYPAFGGGCAISNLHLIKSDFELMIGFYPVVPGSEPFRFRLNPVDFWSTTFTDYSFGRPETLPFE